MGGSASASPSSRPDGLNMPLPPPSGGAAAVAPRGVHAPDSGPTAPPPPAGSAAPPPCMLLPRRAPATLSRPGVGGAAAELPPPLPATWAPPSPPLLPGAVHSPSVASGGAATATAALGTLSAGRRACGAAALPLVPCSAATGTAAAAAGGVEGESRAVVEPLPPLALALLPPPRRADTCERRAARAVGRTRVCGAAGSPHRRHRAPAAGRCWPRCRAWPRCARL